MSLFLLVILVCSYFCANVSYRWMGVNKQQQCSSRTVHYRLRCSSSSISLTSAAITEKKILRKVDNWACVRNCGACCKLGIQYPSLWPYMLISESFFILFLMNEGPIDSRPFLDTYLTPAELEKYKSMIRPDDGWCVNFDKEKRICTIYDDRPTFCRVDVKTYKKMYDIEGS